MQVSRVGVDERTSVIDTFALAVVASVSRALLRDLRRSARDGTGLALGFDTR